MRGQTLTGIAITVTHAGFMHQLIAMVNWHLNQGVEHIFIYLDRPKNDYSTLFSSESRVTLNLCTQEYWDQNLDEGQINVEAKQNFATTKSFKEAEKMGIKYVASIDSDELIYTQTALANSLDKQPAKIGAFMLGVSEARRSGETDLSDPFGADIFLKQSAEKTVIGKAIPGAKNPLQYKFHGYSSGKTIYRIPANFKKIKVHRPAPNAGDAKFVKLDESFGTMLHFDCGSIETWRAKWTQRLIGTTLATGMRDQRRQQLDRFAQAYSNGLKALETLYDTNFILNKPAIENLTLSDGLIEPVLQKSDFSAPINSTPTSGYTSFDICPDFPSLESDTVAYQFAMACDRNFVKPAYACILSLMDKFGAKQPVRIYLLTDSLLSSDFAFLNKLSDVFKNLQLEICDETLKLDRDVGVQDQKRATFSRLYLPEHVQSGRLIYIDSDMLVMKDISYLFSMDMGENIIAGVSDSAAMRIKYNPDSISAEQTIRLLEITGGVGNELEYLNAGLLVLNMDHPEYLSRALAALKMLKTHASELRQRDQDAVNIAFKNRKMFLSSKLNYMIQFFESNFANVDALQKIKEENKEAEIFHFSGKQKPWHFAKTISDPYVILYRSTVQSLEQKWGTDCQFDYMDKPKVSGSNIGMRIYRKLKLLMRRS